MTLKNYSEVDTSNSLRIGLSGPQIINISGLKFVRFLNGASSQYISIEVGEPTDDSHLVPSKYLNNFSSTLKKFTSFKISGYHGAYNQDLGTAFASPTLTLCGVCLFKWSVLSNLYSSPTATLRLTIKRTSSAVYGVELNAVKISDESVTSLYSSSGNVPDSAFAIYNHDISYDLSGLDPDEDYRLELTMSRSSGVGNIYLREAFIDFEEIA